MEENKDVQLQKSPYQEIDVSDLVLMFGGESKVHSCIQEKDAVACARRSVSAYGIIISIKYG